MKRRAGVCAAALAVAGAACWAQDGAGGRQAILMDGVAAYVNDAVITISEVMNEVRRSPLARAADRDAYERQMRERYRATLNAMIDRRLILDYAKKTKAQLQPWAVDARIREIVANNFDGDQTKLYDLLSERKVSVEEWKRGLEEDMLLSAMRYQYVEKRVSVTPSEIRAEYEANKPRYQTESAVAVSLIVLDPPGEGEEAVEARVEAIAAALKEGVPFADLARKYSRDSKAINGGSWGKVNPEDVFRKELADALALLKPGEVSPLVALDGYGYILRKDDQQDSRVLTFEEASRYAEGHLKMERSEQMYQEWVARLRSEAYIRLLELPDSK